MAFLFAILMWGVVYQGYNAVFPSFYQELFPTKTRVSAFAVSQNIGTLITAFLPTIYAAIVGPTPGACVVDKKFAAGRRTSTVRPAAQLADSIESSVIWTVGGITFGLAIIAAIACLLRPGDLPHPPQRPRQQERRADSPRGVRADPEHRGGRAGLSVN